MGFYEQIALLTYSTIDFIAFEVLLLGIFIVEDGKIKLTVEYLFADLSSYKKSGLYVFIVLILGILYFYGSNIFQERLVSFITLQKIKTIPAFLMSISFAVFWLAKVTLGRKWNFPLVLWSIIIFLISGVLLFL